MKSMASRILRKGIRWFSWPMISTLISSMEWPASLACSDTSDLRSQACTDFRFSFRSFSLCAQFRCCFTDVLCITILASDIVNVPKFFRSHDLIFWSYQSLMKGAMGFETNVNSTLLKESLKNLGDPTTGAQ